MYKYICKVLLNSPYSVPVCILLQNPLKCIFIEVWQLQRSTVYTLNFPKQYEIKRIKYLF